MSLVKVLGADDRIISIKTHLKRTFGFSGFSDLAFLLIEEILYYVQKGYGSILSSVSSQTLAVSLLKNDMVDM